MSVVHESTSEIVTVLQGKGQGRFKINFYLKLFNKHLLIRIMMTKNKFQVQNKIYSFQSFGSNKIMEKDYLLDKV